MKVGEKIYSTQKRKKRKREIDIIPGDYALYKFFIIENITYKKPIL